MGKDLLLSRLRADETVIGQGAKFLGFLAIIVSFIEYFMHGSIEVWGLTFHSTLTGFGIASVLYGYLSQSKKLRKTVLFDDKLIPIQLDFFLREIRDKFNADGAFICKYHNGDSFGTFPSGRFTMIRSADRRGVYSDPDQFYNQPMTLYTKFYSQLHDQGFAFVKKDDVSPEFRLLMEKEGTDSLILIPVYKPLSDHHHGMVGIRYTDTTPEIDHEDIEWLTERVRMATGIMPMVKVKKLV